MKSLLLFLVLSLSGVAALPAQPLPPSAQTLA